ncbi:unnamed protein product [Adineta ricciae]|uniref:Macoilin n=1 Tax=Adineta ricciae TaxID=249248 RepID=A0A814R7B8_ADIRI|nr:unnamed protein product [Adineta ricciae]
MKRRSNFDSVKIRKSPRRSRLTDGIYGSAFMYLKFVCIWGIIMAADFLLEFRFEFLWPFWLVLRSICDSFKYQGLLFSIFFVFIAFVTDLTCYILLPVQWLFFAASSYVWIQYVWQTERGICLGTVVLWVLFVWLEASVRLREIKTIDLCRPFAAHCIGYPMVTLGFGFKTYLAYKWRLRKQREVRKVNESYIQLINQALPIEVQQEAEKERLSREKGTFSENYDDVSQPSADGNCSSTSPTLSTVVINSSSNSLSNNSTVNNSQPPSSTFCIVSKRSSKNNQPDGLSSSTSNTFVQSATRNTKMHSITTTLPTTNGHDDSSSSSYKQQKPNSTLNNGNSQPQKKQSQKSSTTSIATTTTAQSRRQSKKQESLQTVSRDSSASHVNGFGTNASIDNSDADKDLQINKLEADVQRLNQAVEKQKTCEMQLRTQISDLKNIRKDLEDVRNENSDIKTKYDAVSVQRQRDRQRITDLERNLNEERQNRQRLDSQIRTEKTLTKKLQDDLAKLSLTPIKNECTEQCLKRKRDLENETREIRRLLNDKDERIKLLDNEIKALKYRESQTDTEVLYQHLAQLQESNTILQDRLSAETRIKLDLFSALGEVRRQLEIANNTVREKERELTAALQSQSNCIFNGHPHSGHSSPTHQLIDTNNNPTTATPSCSSALFYPSTNVTPPPLQNAASGLDPNAQDFCLATHSTSNN